MPGSELARKATALIKAADKLARDISKLLEAARDLKEGAGGKEDGNDKEQSSK